MFNMHFQMQGLIQYILKIRAPTEIALLKLFARCTFKGTLDITKL